jgi:hypothetical protein
MRCARLVSGVFRNTEMPLLWQAGEAPQGAFLASRTLTLVAPALDRIADQQAPTASSRG